LDSERPTNHVDLDSAADDFAHESAYDMSTTGMSCLRPPHLDFPMALTATLTQSRDMRGRVMREL
jgi:hypothetical protein